MNNNGKQDLSTKGNIIDVALIVDNFFNLFAVQAFLRVQRNKK